MVEPDSEFVGRTTRQRICSRSTRHIRIGCERSGTRVTVKFRNSFDL